MSKIDNLARPSHTSTAYLPKGDNNNSKIAKINDGISKSNWTSIQIAKVGIATGVALLAAFQLWSLALKPNAPISPVVPKIPVDPSKFVEKNDLKSREKVLSILKTQLPGSSTNASLSLKPVGFENLDGHFYGPSLQSLLPDMLKERCPATPNRSEPSQILENPTTREIHSGARFTSNLFSATHTSIPIGEIYDRQAIQFGGKNPIHTLTTPRLNETWKNRPETALRGSITSTIIQAKAEPNEALYFPTALTTQQPTEQFPHETSERSQATALLVEAPTTQRPTQLSFHNALENNSGNFLATSTPSIIFPSEVPSSKEFPSYETSENLSQTVLTKNTTFQAKAPADNALPCLTSVTTQSFTRLPIYETSESSPTTVVPTSTGSAPTQWLTVPLNYVIDTVAIHPKKIATLIVCIATPVLVSLSVMQPTLNNLKTWASKQPALANALGAGMFIWGAVVLVTAKATPHFIRQFKSNPTQFNPVKRKLF